MVKFMITSIIAILGGYVGKKLHMPAGTLIGAMIFTAGFNIIVSNAFMPMELKFFTQAATGAYIGAKISKADLQSLGGIIKPAVILMAVMLAVSIGMGVIICNISELTIATALFSMAPAGVSDMALAAMDFDSEPSVVAFMQTMRIVFIICVIPVFIKFIYKRQNKTNPQSLEKKPLSRSLNTHKSAINLFLTVVVALLCGLIGRMLEIPSGAIICSMFGCSAFNIVTGRGYMPLKLRQFIQIFAGGLIGCTVGREQLAQMKDLAIVVILGTISFILMDIIAALIITRFTNMDLVTALFACSPGGLTDMSLIAEEMGADSLKVASMHTIRLVSVIALYPIIIDWLLTF